MTSGKSRPLDLLLNKGLEVIGGPQRGHDFPRTAGSCPSMDVGILGYLLMALEHRGVRGRDCVLATLAVTEASGGRSS